MTFLFFLILLASIAAIVYFSKSKTPSNTFDNVDLLDENGDPISPGDYTLEMDYFCVKNTSGYVSVWPKDRNTGTCIEFELAGMTYRENISHYVGEHVGTLKAEPTNEHDPNAIMVLAEDGHHVGYVPRFTTDDIHRCYTLPCQCYFYIGTYDDAEGLHYYSKAYVKI